MKRIDFRVLGILSAAVAGLGIAASADAATIFSDNFSASTLNGATNTPPATSSNYDIVSNKSATGAGIASGHLTVPITTSIGYAEVQTLFGSSPVALATIGDSIRATVTFTDTANAAGAGFLNGASTFTYLGLYNSGGSAPLNTLNNNGVAMSPAVTGGAQGWTGYLGAIAATGSNSQTYARPAQAGTSSAGQDVIIANSSGGFSGATTLGTAVAGSNLATLGQQYTQDLLITLTAANTLSITNSLYFGATNAGTLFSQSTGTAAGANFFSSNFDAVAFGFRSGTANYDANSITIDANIAATPEPA
ncbi:MAG: hypothetical protein JWM57_125 [Phycisphaerales bacterium]|nr:hypothetical protein [Phycisphaerales bacterium]